jgi:hypothetical protein
VRLSFYARLKNHWPLGVVLLIYVTIATGHSLVVPLTMGNDEWAHFLYIRFIAEHGRLPANLAERRNWDEVGYKSDDPPLYHLFVSGVTAGVEPTRLLRPINAPQRQLADSVVYPYEFILHIGPEMFPYRGEVLLWHLARGVSIIFGMVVIGVAYFTSLELFGNRRWATQAAALLAFMPAIIFHSSVVSYDSLSAAITSLFLLVGIKTIKQPQRWRWWLLLGGLAGLAITTKYSSVLLPLEIVFIGWLACRVARQRVIFTRILVAGLAALLAASWWFGFTLWHFNTVETRGWLVGILEPLMVRGAADSTAVSITAFLLGEENVSTDVPTSPLARDYLYLVRHTIESFWSAPINGKFVLSPWLSLLFTVAGLLGLAGLWRVWQRSDEMARTWLILLLFHTLLIVPLLLVRLFLSFDPLEVAQGRHFLIPAASAIAILLVWGWEQWHRKLSRVCITGLLLWSVIGQLGWAAVVYPPPLSVWAGESPEMTATQPRPLDETLVDALHLTGIAWQESPDQLMLEVTLWWESLAEMQEDYLIELALLDQAGNIVSYTVGHPVQGRYPTRAWEPGDVVKDVHWLPLVGPLAGVYQLRLRLLTREAQPVAENQTISLGEIHLARPAPQPAPCAVWFEGRPARSHLFAPAYRVRSTLTVIGPELPTLEPVAGQHYPEQKPLVSINDLHLFIVGPDWAESYRLVVGSRTCHTISFDLPPRHFALPEIPNPLVVNFNNEVELLGYELPTRRIQPGQRLPLTLYWRALTYMGEDYHIFDNLLDQQQRRWGGYDRRARDGYSTLLWVPGEVITDPFGVPVDPAAPDGVYTLDLGLYRQTEQGAASLPLVVDGQPTEQTSIRLGPIKVGGPPPDVISDSPTPQVKLNQSLGAQITLLGYDLTDQDGRPISTLSSSVSTLELTLYWQADASPTADYTTFLHLRDASNQTVAQKDTPPARGRYPTSLWDPGEIIIDEISLPLDNVSPGRYTPVVGLYNLATGERLLVPGNPNNEISLESIELP